MRIGFIGLGAMGESMARHLRAAGHPLAVWARRPESAAGLVAEGVPLCATPAELAARSEVVVTIVTASADVEALAFGGDGLAEGFAKDAIHLDMSTIAPDTARRLAERYARQGVDWVDAPVSGGPQGARDATLAIMAGAHPEVLERVRPLLEVLGKRIVHIGPPGAGQVAKACNQILTGVGVAAVAEALNFATRSGVDAGKVREALLGGFAYSRILENHGQRMLERNFKPGFKAWMHQKDMRIVMEEAHRLGLALPSAAATAQMFNALVGSGMGEDDSVAMLKLLERMSGGEGA